MLPSTFHVPPEHVGAPLDVVSDSASPGTVPEGTGGSRLRLKAILHVRLVTQLPQPQLQLLLPPAFLDVTFGLVALGGVRVMPLRYGARPRPRRPRRPQRPRRPMVVLFNESTVYKGSPDSLWRASSVAASEKPAAGAVADGQARGLVFVGRTQGFATGAAPTATEGFDEGLRVGHDCPPSITIMPISAGRR